MKNKLALLLVTFFLFSAFKADKPAITIFMIGDSTMANKKLDGGNPERGWGHVLPGFFSEDIVVDNHAQNGRSSKSFINEGRWEKVISQVKKGDYVFIQFGQLLFYLCIDPVRQDRAFLDHRTDSRVDFIGPAAASVSGDIDDDVEPSAL